MDSLALREDTWNELRALLDRGQESAGVLLARAAVDEEGATFLVQEVFHVDPEHYERRDDFGLSIRSAGYMAALKNAALSGRIPIFFHTHPHGSAIPSVHDDIVDHQVAELFRTRSNQSVYASVVIGGSELAPTFTGRAYRKSASSSTSIAALRSVGRRLRLYAAEDESTDYRASDLFDRQVQMFGREGQHLLARLTVGVVGAGGTGSAVCEQLIRLGVGRLVVVDYDEVSDSNITRIHQSSQSDVGRPKVEVVADEALRIGTGTQVRAIRGNVAREEIAAQLSRCDVLFGCTDDDAGRAVLSRLAYWYLIPVFDCGFVIVSDSGIVGGLFGRVTTLQPGEACLICRRRVDPARIRNQLLREDERSRLAAEGYAPELGDADPSVVTYTTLTASLAVSELLERLFGYGAEEAPSELLLRLHSRDLRGNRTPGRDGHYCTDVASWGRGDESPLLGQLWPS